MESLAMIAARACQGAAAYTLAGGYAVKYPGDGSGRVLFQPGRVLQEKRNPAGRCTLCLVEFSDGSRLRFTWNPARGSRLAIDRGAGK